MNLSKMLRSAQEAKDAVEYRYEYAKLSFNFYKDLHKGETKVFLIAPEEVLADFIEELEEQSFLVTQGEDKTNCTVTF